MLILSVPTVIGPLAQAEVGPGPREYHFKTLAFSFKIEYTLDHWLLREHRAQYLILAAHLNNCRSLGPDWFGLNRFVSAISLD